MLFLGLALFVVVAGAVFLGFSGKQGGNISGLSVQDNEINDLLSGVSQEASSSNSIKEFNMIARQYEFVPETIIVNKGDTVVLHIKSVDVDHGIAIPEFGVNQPLTPGSEETVRFVADKKGTYTFFCNAYCGSGHGEMKGTLVVN